MYTYAKVHLDVNIRPKKLIFKTLVEFVLPNFEGFKKNLLEFLRILTDFSK